MNNQELELKVLGILKKENFFDAIVVAKDFEKEYKESDFYKQTKMSLFEVIKESRFWYSFQLKNIGEKIQNLINDLDLTKINELIKQLGDTYAAENSDIMSLIKEFGDIVK